MKTIAILNNHGYTPLVKHNVEVEVKEFDQSITDPTFFTPIGSLIRKLNAQDKIAMSRDPKLYDFPDGKDTGMEIPLARKKGVDLAELSQEVTSLTEKVNESLKKDAKRRKQEQSEKLSTSSVPLENAEGAE